MKAIVFDFGGVMTATTMPELARGPVEELGVRWEAVEDGFRRYRHAYDAGDITMLEMYARIWADAGVSPSPEATRRVIEADRASWLRRNERTQAWMKRLHDEGRAVGILTNMAPDFAPLFLEHYADFVAQADAMVISGLERMHKPNRDIYDLLYARLSAARADVAGPHDLVFIDDVEENCRGAEAAGWRAIRFRTNDQVEAEWEKAED